MLDMTWENYRGIKAMNGSTLVAGLKSMLHLKNTIDGKHDIDSEAMKFGRLVHCAVLEPDELYNRFCVVPELSLIHI